MERLAGFLYKDFWVKGETLNLLLAIGETVPFYCSEAKDGKFDTPECRQLLGYALQGNNYLFVTHRFNADPAYMEKASKFYYPGMIHHTSEEYHYHAYVKKFEGNIAKRISFTNNRANSVK